MESKLNRLTIDNSIYMHYDVTVVDRRCSDFIFSSIIAGDALLKNIQTAIKKKVNCYLEGKCHCSIQGKFDVEKERGFDSDFSHMIIKKQDVIEKYETTDDEMYTFYTLYKDENELVDILYDKLYANTSIPILKDWMQYIIDRLERSNNVVPLTVYHSYDKQPFFSKKIMITKTYLLNLVQTGLRSGDISINGTNDVSDIMNEITGLDMYLNIYGDILAEKIQKAFVPKFDPHNDTYSEYVNNYDDSCHYAGIELYEAQKAVIESAVRNLDKNKTTFVIGEMGCGKTAIGSGIVYSHSKKKSGTTSVVICPGHLVIKWKREVERFIPNAKGYIVENINELIALVNIIKDKSKKEHSFIILSKETAKFTYESRPAAIWSKSKKCFICPECGQKLFKYEWIGTGRNRVKIKKYLTEQDFAKEGVTNTYCLNKIKKLDKKNKVFVEEECHNKLWAPLNRFEENSTWIKLGTEGWIMKSHIKSLHDELFAKRESLNKKEQKFLSKLMDKVDELDENGDVTSSTKGVRKYSIAKYIKEKLKGRIDYLLIDELHELKGGNSLQGQAMGDLAVASKKVIGLTGTLLNGYADGLFYILYRTMPEIMKYDGFEYSDEAAFQRTYGVVKVTSEHERGRNGRAGARTKTGTAKRLPGVSPLVFTKFLLENAVFISISDMAEGLPDYQEIPIPVQMDSQLAAEYDTLERNLRDVCSWGGGGGKKAMGALLQTLSTYPDMPYDQMPVLHPDTAEILCTPNDLEKGLRNKENALINLIREKKAAGEKVLVYYEWTNKTDVADKILNGLKEYDIKAVNLTSSVKAKDRESWVEKQLKENDIDVLMCNPNLVKTGLDLLDFTSIVFYQMGYNIFTMRQASRRSWRLSQTEDIKVYFMFYQGTIQEQAIGLMASKLQASMALEGKFSEEGLRAMADNEDLLSQIAGSVVDGIKHTVDAEVFTNKRDNNSTMIIEKTNRNRKDLSDLLVYKFNRDELGYLIDTKVIKKKRATSADKFMENFFSKGFDIGSMYSRYKKVS